MNPLWLDNMSWEMAEVYGAITDQILINLAKYFPYYTAGNVPKSAFTYQAAMLAQMGQVNRETVQIIRNGLKGADKALGGILEQAIIESVKKAEPSLWKGVQKGIFMPPQTPVVAPNQYRAFQLYYKQAADKLNLVNTVMLESTQQAYRNTVADIAVRVQATQTALDIGAGETVTGVSSWNQAVKHSIDRMKDGGITGFIDHAGRRWSAEAYAAMDIRTTMYNTSRAAVWETNQNFGNDLYLVSYHSGARPLCYDWQNKVISSMNAARDVTDLDGNVIHVYAQSETTYGEAAGLFGINCKHYPSPFIPGVSTIRGEPQSPEENAKAYAESQHQRGLERKIREEKRDLLMMKAQGAPDEMIKAQREKIRKTDDDIDAFCAETGRARRQNREGVYTQRDFPDAKTYDVTQFTNEQKERIERYYQAGGEQQGFTFGQMTPNVPLVPNTPTPAPPVVPPATPVPQNVAQQATTSPTVQHTIEGHTEKLKGTLSETEYQEVVKMVDNSETAKLYETYGDSCASIVKVPGGGRYTSWDTVEYDFDTHPGIDKYSVMGHEMAHMFDAKIGRASTLTFNEVDLINTKCTIGSGASKAIRVKPSASDQFLTAMRKDKAKLQEILGNSEELLKLKTGTWRNSTSGVQDAMDGFFSTQDKNILPWGHGNKYYNRGYNNKIKGFGLEDKLAEAYDELGFALKNKTAVKTQFRDYETANELWANVVSALTCGGDELKAFKTYMPETVDAAISIIRGL